MSFQSAVQIFTGLGVPGELYQDAPSVVQSYILNSADAAYNIIGATAFTVSSQGVAEAGSGGAGGYAGILVDPKNQALFGNVTSPTLVLPNYSQGELLTMGIIVVTLPASAAIGDHVVYDDTTGALSTVAANASLPVGKQWANAIVTQYTVSGAGLAVIQVGPGLGVPVA